MDMVCADGRGGDAATVGDGEGEARSSSCMGVPRLVFWPRVGAAESSGEMFPLNIEDKCL
jgi:hypothetical protein